MNLKEVIRILDAFAPLKKAKRWDNVGLLIEPTTEQDVRTIYLTNELSRTVLKEAVENDANLIISYIPPVFEPLTRITQKTWKERLVTICLEKHIAVYSPHTAWDVANEGINSWIAKQFDFNQISPIREFRRNPSGGIGRKISLINPICLNDCIDILNEHVGNPIVNIAFGNNSDVDTIIKDIAICIGSHSSLLKDVKADLYISGEMSTHQLSHATKNNISVVLCNYSNLEIGYLKEFKFILNSLLNDSCKIVISTDDEYQSD